ncbi:MAG: RecQ family ATP-dependent DNA helicase [Edaphobacter sp.]|uniref:RecQ family ATP-dependent DNA helicase n=1 Tax=Edaphobacter sp. TaxID=1934404 RepID=UPI00239D074D|nr:RecQ family ATP-dependent DNA helicase [Edaphobacter sp.]MDE1175469.1 RecQ family ATP-dependent DNA helicase [Edaphobacter sp.]
MHSAPRPQDLSQLLHQVFGFPGFRANQEAVCRAASDGRDVLLVMPTGAGKSLCYQLPAIARGGTALVISPLIALMDDQAAKLSALGLKVARIHSGLSRDESRQACRDYLSGDLQFLFIAPERMRVPGFPEMLAKRKPALIAIDEAHCISQWGHDFRPDYRTLGDHLPALRPAPVIALTATATPTVQKDIAAQLRLSDPALFIHGFRRHNLAIEVVEMSKPQRSQFTVNLLKASESRPAIVYAPSRKAAEELASQLGRGAAAYHAGLEPATRERIQRHFLGGNLEVVVATIAFGMGIDKADVRTVVHIALPGSVEAYYQEIGRAGRDGNPSRTVLLHSFADRKMHDFFLERDYPEPTELARLARVLSEEFQEPEALRKKLRMDLETFERTAEKLVAQSAAAFDIAGNLRAGENKSWQSGYDRQLSFRRSQIDMMARFAETPQCRMSALIQHFGDTEDGLRPCGHCDFCSPERATAQTFREPSSQEDRHLRAILRTLDGQSPRATGKLHSDLALGVDRRQFDAYLNALTRAGLVSLTQDSFTNAEGDTINFKRAGLTYEGRNIEAGDPLGVHLTDSAVTASSSRKRNGRSSSSSKHLSSRPERSGAERPASPPLTPAQQTLEKGLRDWRKAEAAKTGKPAFIIFGDAVLTNIVIAAPQTINELLTVNGIGPEKADRYGAEIIALCRGTEPSANATQRKAEPERKAASSRSSTTPPPSRSKDLPFAKQNASSQDKDVSFRAKRSAAEEPPHFARTAESAPRPQQFTRPVAPTQKAPEADLSPTQQSLDQKLRQWRTSEAERLGLPQFFVLGSSALRNIVLARPQTLADLRKIEGLTLDKAERFGPAIIELCIA